MHNMLVTGGAGFIGSNFIRYTLNTFPDIHLINLDALTYAGSLNNLKNLPGPERYTFILGDICEQSMVENLLRERQINTIVHFAAETHVDRSILNPDQFIQTNIYGTYALLEASRTVWLQETLFPLESVRFHHISTDEVYGSLKPDDPAFSETTPYAPNSPYAASKAASDHLVRAYGHTYGLPYTISNCSNNYGPYQYPEKLIPLMIQNAINGKPLPIYGDGQQIRDWLHVDDHCEAIWAILKDGRIHETYNIGGDTQPTNLEIVQQICGILDEQVSESAHQPHHRLITNVADRPGHDRRYAMDITKIKRELTWSPKHTLGSGLVQTIEWYLSQQEWVAAIQEHASYDEWIKKNYERRG